jgi:hypothetical protein
LKVEKVVGDREGCGEEVEEYKSERVKEFGKGKDNAKAQSARRLAEKEEKKPRVKMKKVSGFRL